MADFDLSEVDNDDLMQEIMNRELLDEFSTNELIDALATKSKVETVDVNRGYDYVVAVELGSITTGSGKATILIIED